MSEQGYRKRIIHRPPCYSDGQSRFVYLPKTHKPKGKWDEESVATRIISNMTIAGRWFSTIMPKLYLTQGPRSGLMVTVSVPSKKIAPDMSFPGDIDILAIPFDGDYLILSELFAVELKVLRCEK